MARRLSKIVSIVEASQGASRRLSLVAAGAEHERSVTVRRLSKLAASVEESQTITRRRVSAMRVMVEWSRTRRGRWCSGVWEINHIMSKGEVNSGRCIV